MGSGESSIRVLEVSDDVFPGSLSYRLVEETGISVPRGAGVGARVFGSSGGSTGRAGGLQPP
jgi:hypothetical protein